MHRTTRAHAHVCRTHCAKPENKTCELRLAHIALHVGRPCRTQCREIALHAWAQAPNCVWRHAHTCRREGAPHMRRTPRSAAHHKCLPAQPSARCTPRGTRPPPAPALVPARTPHTAGGMRARSPKTPSDAWHRCRAPTAAAHKHTHTLTGSSRIRDGTTCVAAATPAAGAPVRTTRELNWKSNPEP
jgi:hypothetical protein